MLKLSIIIPVFNEVDYLEQFTKELLDSFKNEKVEYIFVDDGSYDGTSDWLFNFCNHELNKNCQLISLKKNIGKKALLKTGKIIQDFENAVCMDTIDLLLNAYTVYAVLDNPQGIFKKSKGSSNVPGSSTASKSLSSGSG